MQATRALRHLRMRVAAALAAMRLATVLRTATVLCTATMTFAAMPSFALAAGQEVTKPLPGQHLYEITTETGMPHLEESLRYAVVKERSCLDSRDLSRAFWMLEDVSLQDCRLIKTSQTESGARYDLRCDGGHGTSGSARWEIGPERLRGTLDVKLGGKNMTFYQRVVARAVEECGGPSGSAGCPCGSGTAAPR